jgi:alkylation response protein AidB-like acyl-CoA dehydrogenase
MDLELTDEQTWLAESIDTLLQREWPVAERAHEAGAADRDRLWNALAAFGVLAVDREDGLGAVELCLTARALGGHLASVPFSGSTAVRYALERHADHLPGALEALGDDRVAVALLEPGRGWSPEGVATAAGPDGLRGAKVAVEHADAVDRLAVVARVDGAPGLVVVPAAGIAVERRPSIDETVPQSAVALAGADLASATVAAGDPGAAVLARLVAVGGLLAAAESVGAADALLRRARDYAAERRQFGRTIGSNQALRHILASMYVRATSSWSTVLYAAAALDDELEDAEETAAVAKAYVARGAREVAHGALQVFGGIAFTQEHEAHRFLRRIILREREYGDALHHERRLGRLLAARAAASRTPSVPVGATNAPVA